MCIRDREYTSGSQIILRDNLAPMVKGKHVLILAASITTGYTIPVSYTHLLEILRTIHSFDPCLACAVHLYDEEGKYVHQVDTF